MKIHSEPFYEKGHRFQVCNWIDEKGICVFQERSYWPKMFDFSKDVVVHYWITDALYTDKSLAEKEAKEFGFRAQLGFYCDKDNPHWFPIFYDFEKVLAFLKAKTGVEYLSE